MHGSLQTAAHVTHVDEADVTDLLALRKRLNEKLAPSGTRLTLAPFFVKALVAGLKLHPKLNASFDAATNDDGRHRPPPEEARHTRGARARSVRLGSPRGRLDGPRAVLRRLPAGPRGHGLEPASPARLSVRRPARHRIARGAVAGEGARAPGGHRRRLHRPRARVRARQAGRAGDGARGGRRRGGPPRARGAPGAEGPPKAAGHRAARGRPRRRARGGRPARRARHRRRRVRAEPAGRRGAGGHGARPQHGRPRPRARGRDPGRARLHPRERPHGDHRRRHLRHHLHRPRGGLGRPHRGRGPRQGPRSAGRQLPLPSVGPGLDPERPRGLRELSEALLESIEAALGEAVHV